MLSHVDQGRFRGQRVGVVFGGESSEREVSLMTGNAFIEALVSTGYEVQGYDLPADLPILVRDRPAAVLLGLHGGSGENGVVQGLLESLSIPYTGSGVMASALAMDKARAKAIFSQIGVATAPWALVRERELAYELPFSLPVVVKPNDGGSSCGIEIARDPDSLALAVRNIVESSSMASPMAGALIEPCLSGPEYTVGFFDDVCLGAIRVEPAEGFYDFHAKYRADDTAYIHVDDEALKARLIDEGRRAYAALGCSGVARVDIMANGDNLFVLEVNTIPGMTATSLVPKMAQALGIDFPTFVELMLGAASLGT